MKRSDRQNEVFSFNSIDVCQVSVNLVIFKDKKKLILSNLYVCEYDLHNVYAQKWETHPRLSYHDGDDYKKKN